jgi:hypothetical protein
MEGERCASPMLVARRTRRNQPPSGLSRGSAASARTRGAPTGRGARWRRRLRKLDQVTRLREDAGRTGRGTMAATRTPTAPATARRGIKWVTSPSLRFFLPAALGVRFGAGAIRLPIPSDPGSANGQ